MIEQRRARFSRKRLLTLGAGIVALALVITGVAALSSPREAPEKTETTAVLTAERLAQKAEDAASREHTQTALALVAKALAADPDNPTARRLQARLVAESEDSAQADGGAAQPAAGSAVSAAGPYDKPIDELATLLPSKFRAWKRGAILSASQTAVVTFEPVMADPASDAVVRISLYAKDAGTSAKASSLVDKVYKRAYSKDAAKVSVGVVPTGHFGTDGSQLAAVGFARGRYAFEVIVTASPGVKPTTLKALALEAASTMPAAQ